MSAPAAILVDAQAEARAVEAGAATELRPLPVWCPLPRRDDDPKVTCVGWVAGRQVAREDGVVVTISWCLVDAEPPQGLVSRPADALRLDRLPAGSGRVWALSRSRSFEWLAEALAESRRFGASLDLGAVNERRAALFPGARWGGSIDSRPVFGRGWWLPGAEPGREQREARLGALDDRFVLLSARGGEPDPRALADALEAAVARRWRAVLERRAAAG